MSDDRRGFLKQCAGLLGLAAAVPVVKTDPKDGWYATDLPDGCYRRVGDRWERIDPRGPLVRIDAVVSFGRMAEA